MNTSIIVGALALALSAACAGFAQTPTTAPSLSCDLDSFGPGFTGANIETVIKRISASAAGQPKSEFETTEQYQQRIQGPGGRLVFVIPDVYMKYDADAAVMIAQMPFVREQFWDDNGRNSWYRSFDLTTKAQAQKKILDDPITQELQHAREEARESLERHQNPFELPAEVELRRSLGPRRGFSTVYGLAFDPQSYSTKANWPTNGPRDILTDDQVKFDMPAEQARAIKPFLKVAVITQSRPHIYKTKDMYTDESYLDVMAVERLVLFDSRTGKILKALPDCAPVDRGATVPVHGSATEVTESGVTAPLLLSKIAPAYTEEARKAGYQGTVLLYVQVNAEGHAVNLRVLHSLEPGLDEKAIEAVRQWRFQPGTKDGKPVTVEAQVEVNFRLLSPAAWEQLKGSR